MKIINILNKSKNFKKIFRFIKNDSNYISLILVGSYSRNSTGHDIDFILIIENEKTIKQFIFFLKKIKLKIFKNIDVYRFYDNDLKKEISFFLITKNNFNKKINKILNGDDEELMIKKTNWAIGGYLSEVFLRDILQSICILDKHNFIDQIKNKLEKFSEKLRIKIIKDVIQEYDNKKMYTNKYAFLNQIAKYELYFSIIRVIFVYNKIYFPGIKHLDEFLNKKKICFNDLLKKILYLEVNDKDIISFISYLINVQS